MSQDWADKIAEQFLSRGLLQTGICLVLGGSDTGKTTLAAALAEHAALSRPVGIVDADIGQSHIGPPATVGWAVVDSPEVDFSQLIAAGISFVGDITPPGNLLQLTAAIVQAVRQLSKAAQLIIIDTPGFIFGPAAAALWWTVQRVLQPQLILAVQKSNELSSILAGLCSFGLELELIKPPPQIPTKSPQSRRSYRRSQFRRYFRDSRLYNISLTAVSVQTGRNLHSSGFTHRLIGLRDPAGIDVAVGLITEYKSDEDIVVVRAPEVDIQRICCLVIGDITVDIAD